MSFRFDLACAASLAFALTSTAVYAQETSAADRYWRFFAERYDADENGEITPAEHVRGRERFRALDRDGDGVLTRSDFEGELRRPGLEKSPTPMFHRMTFALLAQVANEADADGDKRVTKAEWKKWCPTQLEGESVVIRQLGGKRVSAMAGSFVLFALDVDGSGEVRLGELRAAFERLDADTNGVLEGRELATDGLAKRRTPKVGEVARNFTLPYAGRVKTATSGERALRLTSLRGKRPVALIFGSSTSRGFERSARELRALHTKYGERVQFLLIYVREAHAVDGPDPRSDVTLVEEHGTIVERSKIAVQCRAKSGLKKIPMLVDRLDDRACAHYGAFPERACLVGIDGRLRHVGPVNTRQLQGAIEMELARIAEKKR